MSGAAASVYGESRFLVSQKARILSSNANFSLSAPDGRPLGEVREVGRGAMRKLVDPRSDGSRTYRLEVNDANGQPILVMMRPATWSKSRMSVDGPGGQRIGYVVQDRSSFAGGVSSAVQSARSVLGGAAAGSTGDHRGPTYARFRLEASGQVVGRIYAEDFDAWNLRIVDPQDRELARITKEWAGWARERFTRADHYAVEVFASLQDPLRSLVIASAVAVDLALKQGH
ncbi:phospholipid scramblase-related protein [Nocardioides ginkgobilobae]